MSLSRRERRGEDVLQVWSEQAADQYFTFLVEDEEGGDHLRGIGDGEIPGAKFRGADSSARARKSPAASAEDEMRRGKRGVPR
jgi:hypothetical protein